ncbi:signal peptidase I [Peptostreptococcaceae bacterium pGA-8]|nr:signal peptidase I [Peptostreptococcaceae bacterium pGA-8]
MRFVVKEVGIALAITVIVSLFVRPTVVVGRSMEPTFKQSDCLLLSKTAYDKEPPQRGDVIVFRSTIKSYDGKDKILIKRVVGLPGEIVSIAEGKVYINYKPLVDTVSLDGETTGDIKGIEVPENCYFCLGDNRANSTDSRYESVGVIKKKDIIGKAVFKFYPFDDVKKIDSRI